MMICTGEDYFAGTSIKYQGLRVEDTPQTQICRCGLMKPALICKKGYSLNIYTIARHFMEMAQFIDSALSENGKVFVNCVFGRSRSTSLSCSPSSRSSTCSSSTCSRSTSCVVAYLMLKHDWTALKALTHIREKRPIQVIIMVKRTRVYSCTLFSFINWFLHFPPLAVLFLL